MEGKNCVTFTFIKFYSIYLGWLSCFYFCRITFSITGKAPLILKIFNNKTDTILFLIRKLLLLSYALLFTILLLIFLSYICHLIYLLLFYFMNGNSNFISKNVKGIKAFEKRLKLVECLGNNTFIFIIFLQEIHSSSNDEQKWKDDLRGPLFFHMGKSILVV